MINGGRGRLTERRKYFGSGGRLAILTVDGEDGYWRIGVISDNKIDCEVQKVSKILIR